jgi:C-22 sterol desaturase
LKSSTVEHANKGLVASLVEKTGMSPIALVVTIIVGLFVWEQVDYLTKKKHLPGPSFKVPIIGSMMDSMKPTFDKYNSKWKSGDLSCVSVFNRYCISPFL